MSATWERVRLGEVLKRAAEVVTTSANTEYREVTVKLWGKGVVQRGMASGSKMAGARRFVARAGQFILSRIDARNGAVGIVPGHLDGAVVTNDFPLFELDRRKLDAAFFAWLSRTRNFVDLCRRASEGTTNRVRLREDRFLSLEIRLPSLGEQRRIVARLEELAGRVAEAHALREQSEEEMRQMLRGAFLRISRGAPRRPMREAAPLVRRPVSVDPSKRYPELGIRSFGKGTFHKPQVSGAEIGSKRLFRIEPGDLVFNNVFAWEGAVAVAKPEDVNRVGSHRFITCVPRPGVVTAPFLLFFFLTAEGLDLMGTASPGGAGRNRTLGLSALDAIRVPVPAIEHQRWFDTLQARVDAIRQLRVEIGAEMDALLPSVLDRAFKGAL